MEHISKRYNRIKMRHFGNSYLLASITSMELKRFIEAVHAEELVEKEDYPELVKKIKKQIKLAIKVYKQKI